MLVLKVASINYNLNIFLNKKRVGWFALAPEELMYSRQTSDRSGQFFPNVHSPEKWPSVSQKLSNLGKEVMVFGYVEVEDVIGHASGIIQNAPQNLILELQ